jgi:hypothetical protein
MTFKPHTFFLVAIAGWMNRQQQQVIEYLPQNMKDAADDLVGELSSDAHYTRTRLALLDLTDGKEDLGRVNVYVPMQRTDITYETTDQELLDELAARRGLTRAFVERGMTKERKKVPPAYQRPIRLGLVEVYFSHVAKREHLIAQARLVKDLQRLLHDTELRDAIRQTQGEAMLDVLERYVNRLANPSFYKAFGQIATFCDSLRQRTAVVHLGFNVMAYLKQAPSVALFLGEVGPTDLMAGIAKMLTDWKQTVEFIHQRDPQMATRSVERELEELRRLNPARYEQTIGKLSRISLEGLYVLDRFATHAGWIAKYEQMLRVGASEQEAIRAAQQAVLRTQNAASAKDIADLYAQDGFINLWLLFTNQLNQMWNQAAYDIPRRFLGGRPGEAVLGGIGMALNAVGIWILTHGRLPDDFDDLKEAALEQWLSLIPLFGGMLNSLRQGFDAGLPAGMDILVKRSWMTAKEAGKFFDESDDVDMGKLLDNAAYVGALAFKLPYTQIRRTWLGLAELTSGDTDDLRRLLWSEHALQEDE